MIDSPKLTIALLTYNRSQYLRLAIEAILSQSYKDFIFLILDNASTDNTEEIVNSFCDDRIKYIKHEKNIGSCGNGFKAFELTKTQYLIMAHDDDMMMPDMIKRELDVLEKNQNVVIVSSNTTYIDEAGNLLKKAAFNIQEDIVYKKHDFVKAYCNGKGCISCPTVMYRTSFFKKHNLKAREEVGPAGDTYLWFEVNNYDNVLIYVIKDPLLYYRVHQGQDSQAGVVKMHYMLYFHTIKYLEKNGLKHLIKSFQTIIRSIVIGSLLEKYFENKINEADIKEQIFIFKDTVNDFKIMIKTIIICSLLEKFFENKISAVNIKEQIFKFKKVGLWNVKANISIRQSIALYMVIHCSCLLKFHHQFKISLKSKIKKISI